MNKSNSQLVNTTGAYEQKSSAFICRKIKKPKILKGKEHLKYDKLMQSRTENSSQW